MRVGWAALFATLLWFAQTAAPVSGQATFAAEGAWAGFIQDARDGLYFVLQLSAKSDGSCTGEIAFPRESERSEPVTIMSCFGNRVQIQATSANGRLTLAATADEFTMRGRYTLGGRSGLLTLLPMRRLPREQLLPFTGDFTDGAGTDVVVGESLGSLYYFDRRTGRTGRLYPLQPGRFYGGPAWLIFQPAVVNATFARSTDGLARELALTLDGRTLQLARAALSIDSTISFSAAGGRIAGTLRVPLGRGPFPAILLIAGSNAQPRSGYYAENEFVADQFVRLGMTTLTFDKRGTGDSTGAPGDDSVETVAAAAFTFLKSQPEVDRSRIGIWGISQGGMIAPRVATLVAGVQFIINCSGAVIDANTQEIERTALQMRADGFPESQIREAVAFQTLKFHYAQTGEGWDEYAAAYQRFKDRPWFPDPYVGPPASRSSSAWAFWRDSGGIHPDQYWRSFRGPVLLIYGEHEVLSDPADDTALFVAAMRQAGNDEYAIVRIPNAEHSMLIATTGGFKEARTLTRYSLPYFNLLGAWLALHGIVAAPATALPPPSLQVPPRA